MSKEKVRIDDVGHVLNVHTEDGAEIPDPRPMAPPINFKRQPPLHERIRAMVRDEYARVALERDLETPEEADDFIIPGEDDDDPRESRFALMPGHEWEDNYEPPTDFKDMKDRLIAAGWTPPSDQTRTPPEGGAAGSDTPSPAPGGDSSPPASAPVAKPPK